MVEAEEVQFLNKVKPLAVEVAKPAPEFNKVRLDVGVTLTVMDIVEISVVPFVFVIVRVAEFVVTEL